MCLAIICQYIAVCCSLCVWADERRLEVMCGLAWYAAPPLVPAASCDIVPRHVRRDPHTDAAFQRGSLRVWGDAWLVGLIQATRHLSSLCPHMEHSWLFPSTQAKLREEFPL